MKTTHRFYSEEQGDFFRLCRFYTQNAAHFRRHSTWCLGRIVDWKYGIYESKRAYPSFCEQNAALWFDGFEQLAGAVISESGDAGFVILNLPGYRFLYEQLLDWTLETWAARGPKFFTEISEHQGFEKEILERHGFLSTQAFFTRRFDLTGDLVPRFQLEPGFSIVDMHAHPDYRSQRRLRYNAFHDLEIKTEEEMQDQLKFANYSLTGPIYHAPTDICVMAPDGTLVSGCEALIDGVNAEADIERVATHSSYRQRGFARAAIQECLYRLKAAGLRSAYIAGYSDAAIALYGSLGAVEEQKQFVYER
jgi:ribosomal protein S18 acetylase RimI-like enzyme